MSFGGPEFVILIIAISTGGWLINNWIRARHGYALEDEWGGKTARRDDEQATALADENRELRERVQVLERIVTDKGYGLSTQIEALRADSLTDVREKELR